MTQRELWHSRLISELDARLQFLDGLAGIKTNKAASRGADIEVTTNSTARTINVEVQQFDSGTPWKTTTIPS